MLGKATMTPLVTNVDEGKTTYSGNAGTYMTSTLSSQAIATRFGDLKQDKYGWADGLGNGGTRTGFNPGPAPDRPDVLWRSATDIVIYNVSRGRYGDESDYGHPVAITTIGTAVNTAV